MTKQKTKEKILNIATTLFAQDGYKATTIRRIAKEVGIRESAIYNHYTNKETIFIAATDEILSLPSPSLSIEDIKNTKEYLKKYVEQFKEISYDKKSEKLFRLLMIELLQNNDLRKQFMQNFHIENTKILSKSFFDMMQNSIIRSSDPMVLAYEFLSTLFYIRLQITLLNIDGMKNSFIESMFEKHVDFFWESIKI
jgi:AcrR family transcriptional regulator